VIKLVWDTSALVNIKEPDETGYSPGHSLWKDLSDGWIKGAHKNLLPTIAVFEVNATVSKLERKHKPILRDFYLLNENTFLYDIDAEVVSKSSELFMLNGFTKLYGADLIFACVAHIEGAYLVTMDRKLALHAKQHIKVINLNDSIKKPVYRELFGI